MVSQLQVEKLIEPMEPYMDLLVAAQMLLIICGYHIELAFIQGHQDQGHLTVLTRDTWLDVEADTLAKSKATPYDGPKVYKLPGNPWGCYAGNTWIVKQFNTTLCTWINGHKTMMYWEKHKKLTTSQVNDMD